MNLFVKFYRKRNKILINIENVSGFWGIFRGFRKRYGDYLTLF